MKYFLTTLFIFTCISGFSQTQTEMNISAWDTYKKADTELNDIYQKILIEYKTDTLFIQKLRVSQRIWMKFRDAELEMKYPEENPRYYGSVHPMCESIYLEKLTMERIRTLKIWLEGSDKTDVCYGSVRINI